MIDKLSDKDYNILVINALNGAFAIRLRQRYPRTRIICAETFSYYREHLTKLGFEVIDYKDLDKSMRFDVIAGNPPYQNGNNPNFYVDFIKKSGEILKNDGYFGVVIPNRFLNSGSHSAKALKSWLQPSYVFPDANCFFPKIATSIGVIGGQKKVSPKYERTIPFMYWSSTDLTKNKTESIDRSLSSPCPIEDTSPVSIGIVDKFMTNTFEKMIKSKSGTVPYIYWSANYHRYSPNKPKGGDLGVRTWVNEHDGLHGYYINCPTQSSAELNSWFITKSKLGRFISKVFVGGPNVAGLLSKNLMPMIPENIERSDTAIFNLFGFTDSEIQYIDSKLQ